MSFIVSDSGFIRVRGQRQRRIVANTPELTVNKMFTTYHVPSTVLLYIVTMFAVSLCIFRAAEFRARVYRYWYDV